MSIPANATVGRITDLRPFTTYTCTIHAIAISAGPRSDPITVKTDQQGENLS